MHQTPATPDPQQPADGDPSKSGSGYVIEELPRKRSEPIRVDKPNEQR